MPHWQRTRAHPRSSPRSGPPGHTPPGRFRSRDVIFRKMANRNQTNTNEMTTTETKCQTNFYSVEKHTNIWSNFNKIVLKMPIKYQENTKKFGTEIPNTDLVLVFSWYSKFLVTDWHHYSGRMSCDLTPPWGTAAARASSAETRSQRGRFHKRTYTERDRCHNNTYALRAA